MISRHTSRSIDVIRGLAALGVIWGHSIYGLPVHLELNGAFWVWIFLPVSGYLVAKSFEPDRYGVTFPGYVRFLWNRGLRIVPLAELALAIGVGLELFGRPAEPTTAVSAARQVAFASPLNNMTLVGPLWTVATELHFYLVAIVLVWLLMRGRSRITAPCLWLASIWIGQWAIAQLGDNPSQPRSFVGNLPFFLFGVLLAAARFDGIVRVPRTVKSLLILATVALAWDLNNYHANYFWKFGPGTNQPYGYAAVCALVIAALVICTKPTSAPSAWSRTPMRWPVDLLAWCGFYTYGIYVWHSVLTKLNSTVLHREPGFGLLAILLLAVPLAPLSYRWFEEPFLRQKLSTTSPQPVLVQHA